MAELQVNDNDSDCYGNDSDCYGNDYRCYGNDSDCYGNNYHRYRINTAPVEDISKWPNRFVVKVGKIGLAKHLIKEIIHTRGNVEVFTSRPCMYGVYSGPIGGFAPRPQHCVACLRCMTEYHDFVRIEHNPQRQQLGDSYFHFSHVNAVTYEAQTGMVPVKGAGYRGKFGGEGWDGMWTDMSEIVRPTRDGIHGREFISTTVDIGYKPNFLVFDEQGQPDGAIPSTFSIPLPVLYDAPPATNKPELVQQILAEAAAEVKTLAIVPIARVLQQDLEGEHIIPLVASADSEALKMLGFCPHLIEMNGWDEALFNQLQAQFPESQIALRLDFTTGPELMKYVARGIYVFHLIADYHGRDRYGNFVLDLIRAAHKTFVAAGIREEVTLIGSGGMVAAEHIPKAIICGLDAVAIDTPYIVALQGEFTGECVDRVTSKFSLPKNLTAAWGIQRLQNMTAAWRDQLLEILGAMGIREVRRLRGEMGRAMFMADLEAEAFAEVEGYHA